MLEELYISHNGITTLGGVDYNFNLTTLDVAGNRISKIENIQHLTNLEVIGNDKASISGRNEYNLIQMLTVIFSTNKSRTVAALIRQIIK